MEEELASMGFWEHLEELRTRLLRILAGVAAGYLAALVFAESMWMAIQEPAAAVLQRLGYPPYLVVLDPGDAFSILYVRLPIVAAVFLSSPWTLWQVWRFVAPGLFRKERRLAGPIVISAAICFLAGGLFGYWVALRYGLEFLLGFTRTVRVVPAISMDRYFDLFANVLLGVAFLFELPVVLFLLGLVRVVTAGFLLRHTRYAVLAIVVLAALVTPTQDIQSLALFAGPMIVLYFVGLFAVWVLELGRRRAAKVP